MPFSPRRTSVVLRAVAVIGVAALSLSACSSDSDTESTGSAGTTAAASTAAVPTGDASTAAGQSEPAATVEITIKDFAYGDPLTVAPGTEITVTNLDSAPHDVVPKDGNSWTMKLLEKDQTDSFKAPNSAGSYDFTCSVHANMAGELIVS